MTQKNQIKRSKNKRSADKMDKAMYDVKKITAVSCCLVVVLLLVGLGLGTVIKTDKSYAAGFLTQVPDSFYSGMTTENQALISDISLPKEFYGTDGNERLSYIYCMDHRLGMIGETVNNPNLKHLYEKGDSVKSNFNVGGRNASYKGLIYILQNDTMTGDGAVDYYLTQLAVWWYLDIANGFADDKNYTTPDLSSATDNEDGKYDSYGDYTFYNNLSKGDKATIKADQTYGQYVVNLVQGAVANQDSYNTELGSQEVSVNTDAITYTTNNGYLETSLITPTSNNSSFTNYSIQVNNSVNNIEFLDANNNPISPNNISAASGFKLRVPLSEVEGETFKANVTIMAYFSNYYDAYVYNPNPTTHGSKQLQRALLGKIESPSAPTTFELSSPVVNVPNTASNSYLVYGIGSLIIIAGIVLIVVAKRPNNAKKR